MRILVIGGGGREHAICHALSKEGHEIHCAPGNAGTDKVAVNHLIGVGNFTALTKLADELEIDLTVVGPESPLASGIVDEFQSKGHLIFGPSRAASQLEESKNFAKEVMLAAGVSTAPWQLFSSIEAAVDYLNGRGGDCVIKADGLAAGKGVVVPNNHEEAVSALEDFLIRKSLGQSGSRVLIEEKLSGLEASAIAIVCGKKIIPLALSQDYKRYLDGDRGPNTGGMGAISPTPVLSQESMGEIIRKIFMPLIEELSIRGINYTGFLYAGLMVHDSGDISVLEFNCRIGDPEAQVILPRLRGGLGENLFCAAKGNLDAAPCLELRDEAAAAVVASSQGYPFSSSVGDVIRSLPKDRDDLIVFHAGTDLENGRLITSGGRVLAITALGKNIEDALSKAYKGMLEVDFPNMHYRKDIGGFRGR